MLVKINKKTALNISLRSKCEKSFIQIVVVSQIHFRTYTYYISKELIKYTESMMKP